MIFRVGVIGISSTTCNASGQRTLVTPTVGKVLLDIRQRQLAVWLQNHKAAGAFAERRIRHRHNRRLDHACDGFNQGFDVAWIIFHTAPVDDFLGAAGDRDVAVGVDGR